MRIVWGDESWYTMRVPIAYPVDEIVRELGRGVAEGRLSVVRRGMDRVELTYGKASLRFFEPRPHAHGLRVALRRAMSSRVVDPPTGIGVVQGRFFLRQADEKGSTFWFDPPGKDREVREAYDALYSRKYPLYVDFVNQSLLRLLCRIPGKSKPAILDQFYGNASHAGTILFDIVRLFSACTGVFERTWAFKALRPNPTSALVRSRYRRDLGV